MMDKCEMQTYVDPAEIEERHIEGGGYFYIVEYAGGVCKIGRTTDPTQRMTALKYYGDRKMTGNIAISPWHIEYAESELMLHELNANHRVAGTELFTGNFLDFIQQANRWIGHLQRMEEKRGNAIRNTTAGQPRTLQQFSDVERLINSLSALPQEARDKVVMMANSFIAGWEIANRIENLKMGSKPE